jgi:hypothetical protein
MAKYGILRNRAGSFLSSAVTFILLVLELFVGVFFGVGVWREETCRGRDTWSHSYMQLSYVKAESIRRISIY